jgi:UDP-N-acetylglucosamine acyltransferase
VIDPRAVVSPQAELAADVEVGPLITTWGPTRIGADNQFFQFASIGEAPQDKKYQGEPTRLEVGDRNVFRECCTVSRGTIHDAGVTRIGDDNLLMAYTHVAHDCQLGNRIIMANTAQLAGHVALGDWVIMSGFTAVHQFVKIGAHAFIGPYAAVTRDVPPYVMAVGQPAKPHSINSEGLKRREFSAAQIRNIRNAFRTLYRRGLPLEQAVEELKGLSAAQPEIAALVDFIAVSTRSLIR